MDQTSPQTRQTDLKKENASLRQRAYDAELAAKRDLRRLDAAIDVLNELVEVDTWADFA